MARTPKKPTGGKQPEKRRKTPKIAGHAGTRPTGRAPEVGGAEVAEEATTRPSSETTEKSRSETTEKSRSETTERSRSETTSESPSETASESPSETSAASGTVDLSKPKARPVARVSTLRPRSESADTGAQPRQTRGPGRPSQTGDRRWWALPAILAGVAAILAALAIVLAFQPWLGSDKAFIDAKATSQLTSQAQQRICAIFGYEYTELDAWQKRAQNALTGKAREEFDKSFKAQRDLITQTKTGAECRVDAIGVRDLTGGGDGAHASVIANLVISETQNSIATNSGAPRAQFAMVKEGDTWRIEAVEPF